MRTLSSKEIEAAVRVGLDLPASRQALEYFTKFFGEYPDAWKEIAPYTKDVIADMLTSYQDMYPAPSPAKRPDWYSNELPRAGSRYDQFPFVPYTFFDNVPGMPKGLLEDYVERPF